MAIIKKNWQIIISLLHLDSPMSYNLIHRSLSICSLFTYLANTESVHTLKPYEFAFFAWISMEISYIVLDEHCLLTHNFTHQLARNYVTYVLSIMIIIKRLLYASMFCGDPMKPTTMFLCNTTICHFVSPHF